MSRRRPAPPMHLDDAAKAKWRELVGSLPDQEQGTLDALAAYCSAWSQWTTAATKVAELGAVIRSAQGFAVQSPYVAIAAAAQRQMRQWAGELKMTPKSRSARRQDDDSEQDPILRLIGRAE